MIRRVGRRPRRDVGDDAGFSLIELIVSMGISVMILVVVGGLLTNGIRTEGSVRAAAAATNLGQLIAGSVEGGVRNASAVTVIPGTDAGSQLLLARTVSGGATPVWSCRAWYYTPATGGAIYTMSTTPAAQIPVPSGNPGPGWTLMGAGLAPVDAATSTTVFSAPSGRVDLKFQVSSGTRAPVLVQTTTYLRSSATESAPCF
ncbi:MAG: PulJ/GspJ family protein [Microbacteriaceae bacterium]